MGKGASERKGVWSAWQAGPIRLGVSSCLLGESVRYDGGHKRDPFVVEGLGPFVEWVPVCPEVELGMGVPRPHVHLVEPEAGEPLRLIAPRTGEDFTDEMRAFAARRVEELQRAELDGYVLKKNSPSCGMARVKVHGVEGPLRRDGVGLFAAELRERWPHLPVEEEGRLSDPLLRENFVERVFCRNRWRAFLRQPSRGRLVEFWTAHKLLMRAHDEPAYQRLGKLVGSAKREGATLFARFEADFFAALARRATVKKHANVLQHAMGFLRKVLEDGERRQLHAVLADHAAGLVPLVVPVTLMRFQIEKHGIEYLAGQLYFDPHPKELMLRNHV
jgi:uncharacterized protein YbbK (DUF523 family)/uncharacterized protein YbgA (DUF1722 family)